MTNIQSSPYPLAFPFVSAGKLQAPAAGAGAIGIRTLARALEGMQKEAVVTGVPGDSWRMVSDEGPYLNGTDLAPFPLAFFTTGLVNAYLGEIVACAAARKVAIEDLELTQDNYYSMQGSAVRGDMLGGALPVALHVRIHADAPEAALHELITDAIARAPAHALLRDALTSEFSLARHGVPVQLQGVQPWRNPAACDLSDKVFDTVHPDSSVDFPADVITKLDSAEPLFGAEGGAGSSLASEQKRTLHIRGIARGRADGLIETQVQLYKPTGSNFRFLCQVEGSSAGAGRAPSPLAYVSAGIAFCYLTQIGRYVAITKQPLERYAIVQDTAFVPSGAGNRAASAEPVRTHVELTTELDDATVSRIVRMGERTCFLHAASRTPLETEVRITTKE